MANNFNKLIFEGRLGDDAIMAFAPDGSPYTRFSIACNKQYENKKKSEQVTEVIWYSCVVWGESRAKYADQFKKGDSVLIEGELDADTETGRPRIWFDQAQKPHASFDVTVNTMRWFPKNPHAKDDGEPAPSQSPADQAPSAPGETEPDPFAGYQPIS